MEDNARRFCGRRLYSWLRADCSEEATLSFGELREQACSLCVALRQRWGALTGERVMLVYPPGLDFLVAFVGAQYAAVVAVPYYPPIIPASPMPSAGAKKLLADGLQKLSRIAQSCEPVLFLSTKMYLRAQWLCSMAVRDAECRWPADWKWQATDGAAATPVAARDEEWLAAWLVGRCAPAEPSEIAFLQYTSGSTGHPKGVMVGTRNLLANIDAIAQTRLCHAKMSSVGVERVAVCSWLPQYHDMGLIGGCLTAAVRGWRADLTSPFTFLQRPAVWLQMMTRLKETHLLMQPAPNFGYALCVRRIKDDALSKLSLSHWHIAMNGAEPIRAQTIQDFSARFAACGFDPRAWAPVFGLAENCLYCCGRAEETVILRVDRARLGVGDRPMPQSGPVEASVLEACGHYILPQAATKQAVRIVHNETCEELPDGTVGEIWVCGPSVACGYWQLEDLSNETFRARIKSTTSPTDAPHLRSGDLGFIWERRLYVIGRIKDVLTIKGRTLHAHDIEVCAERGSDILRPGCCAAVPITADGGEDSLVIMAEVRPEAPTAPEELDEALRGAVGEISESEGVRPSAIVLLKARSILKTTSGKLRRREMRQAYAQLVLGETPAEKSQWLIPRSALVHVWRDFSRPLRQRPTRHNPEYPSLSEDEFLSADEGSDSGQRANHGVKPRSSRQGPDIDIFNIEPTPPTACVISPGSSPSAESNGEHIIKAAITLMEAEALVAEVLGFEVSPDAPLMEAGLDSAAAVEFGALLSERVGVPELPETLIFDYPTLRGIVGYLRPNAREELGCRYQQSPGTVPLTLMEAEALVAEVLGFEVSPDAPLMEAGLDSAAAVEFGALLSERVGVPELPETLIFDYPTLRGIVQSLASQQAASLPPASTGPVYRHARLASEGLCGGPSGQAGAAVIAGIAAKLPLGHASPEALRLVSASGADATSEVPPDRWALQPPSVADNDVARRVRLGAFVDNADMFDNKFFQISPAESAAMDPQQRMLLELGYEALHASSLRRAQLLDSLAGVFVGIAAMDFAEVIKSTPYAHSVYSATGSTLSVASGRISYALGLMGPCVSYDTACSAALAACHAALRAMQNDECVDSLVTGASVMLLPGTAFAFATAGMTSANGHCHTFDSRADGYCRGEAICGVALRARMNTTYYQLPLIGSCVRQDGKSASLTAPNGQAQRALLRAALADGGVEAAALSCYEAHGTGTPLGDPIEVRSMAAAVLAARDPSAPLSVGSLKANCGHAEPAAGLAGLLRLAMGLIERRAPPNAQLRRINPHVGSAVEGVACALPTQLSRGLDAAATYGGGGVSSFGYSGTIVHAVLEAASLASVTSPSLPDLVYKRRSFPWYEVKRNSLSPSCRLVGSMRTSSALRRLRRLPEAPALVQLHGLTLDASKDLSDWLRAREDPLVILCRGPVSGTGALLLLDAATVATADATLTLSVQPESSIQLKRRSRRVTTATTLPASDAAQAGLVDSILPAATAVAESRRLVQRLATLSAPLLRTCRSLLPAPSVDAALIAMGSLYPLAPRSIDRRLVRLYVDRNSKVAVVELNDPARMNSFSKELAEDVAEAAAFIGREPFVKAIVLQGAGPHFSVGGNPFSREKAGTPLAAVALGCRAAFDGFSALYNLGVPMVAAVHGKLIGGGIAACLHADYIVADSEATFEHGNLVRGVCVLGMLSQTLSKAVGQARALSIYLTNDTLVADSALRARLVDKVCTGGIEGTQRSAFDVACALAQADDTAQALLRSRVTADVAHCAAEAVGHAECRLANCDGYAKATVTDSHALPPLDLTSVILEPPGIATSPEFTVHTVSVPATLVSLELDWPDNALLVFRGAKGTEHFCLGGDPSQANLESGSFLDSVPVFGQLLDRLRNTPMPKVVVCHGATRGGGMLFPCLGTAVLAHSDATFGFPEIRRGALPGVVSVAARRRLSPAACEWLFCTGDAIDAATAKRLGLVDFVGGWEELEAEVARLERHFLSSAPRLCKSVPLPAFEPVAVEVDADSRVARLEVTADSVKGLWRDALLVLEQLSPSLRVLVLSVEGQGETSGGLSRELCDRLDATMSALGEAGVVVVCCMVGQVGGLLLHTGLAAHYRVLERGTALHCNGMHSCTHALAFRSLHADDAKCFLHERTVGSGRALELGVTSELVEDAGERGLQFAHWLVQHPAIGVRHMLRLTCRPTADEAALGARASNEALLLEGLSALLKAYSTAEQRHPRTLQPPSEAQSLAAYARQKLAPLPPTTAFSLLLSPHPPSEKTTRHAGLHALEVYVPRHAVSAAELETAHGVPGKYTVGLRMAEWAACDEDEDVVSMALTAVRRLVEEHGLRYEDVGMLQVGTESLLDRSKSVKSHLMALFAPHGCTNVEGIDCYHACYGGTAALLACTNWVESSAWDGRWAIAVCTDVSDAPKQYPFMNGAACVAMLVGPDAPLALEGGRVTRILDEWDFYKPVGWPSMGPIVDGPGSMEVYFSCLAACQREVESRGGGTFVDAHDFLVFHLGSGPKFVRHAFESAIAAAHGEGSAGEEEVEAMFERLVAPSLRLASRIGPMHTAATYVNLCSLFLHAPPPVGSRIGVFSFGSGAASTMFHLRVRGEVRMDTRLLERLDARERLPPREFVAVCKRYADTYGRFDWTPRVRGVSPERSYRIKVVGVLGRREYEYIGPATGDTPKPFISPLAPPPKWPSVPSRHAGLHALEVYVPRHAVSAAELETAHGVPGKYTVGLRMAEWAACDEDEDVVSMALTAVRRLVEEHGLRYEDVGMLQVGTESLLDRSKSVKSHLMALFAPHGCTNVEGIDCYHACYGGTAALLACTNWVESSAWDGRWAIAVCTDVSDAPKQYPFMNGAACVAMLVGPDAPLALEGGRVTRILDEWDFYKPVGWPSMGPIVDGPGSMEVYFSCLAACQREVESRGGGTFVDAHDFLVFHLGSGPKFVRHAFESAIAAAHGEGSAGEEEVEAMFERLVAPSLRLASRIGPMHTAATYVNLCSLFLHAPPPVGSRIGVFSFGSGAASTMFHLRVRGEVRMDTRLLERLDARERLPPREFVAVCKRYADTYGRFDWTPRVRGVSPERSYRIKVVGVLGRREYEYVPLAEVSLGAPESFQAQQKVYPKPDQPSADLLQLLSTLAGSQARDGAAASAVDVASVIQSLAREVAGSEVDADAPLMEAGIDSLGAVELRSRLGSQLGVDDLPETLVFDFPTLRQLEAHLASRVATSGRETPGEIPPALLQLLSTLAGSQARGGAAASAVDVASVIQSLAREVAGSEVDADAPLMEAGIDSLGAVELRSRLGSQLGVDDLPETLVFDFPTLRQLEAHLSARVTPTAADRDSASGGAALLAQLMGQVASASQPDQDQLSTQPISVTGTSSFLPGGIASWEALVATSATGCDLLNEVPAARWDVERSPPGYGSDVLQRVRHGGFMQGAELFDNARFSVSPAEATAMDPQQRLLLEHSYAALHASGFRRASLMGSGAGVAVGIYTTEFNQVLAAGPLQRSVYAATGASLSIASGRLSFVLGLQGPCAAFETACSASLVGCHSALRALQHRECEQHLTAGVNAMLVQATAIALAAAGMSSITGRSHTFDSRADGFARGEGCTVASLDSSLEGKPSGSLENFDHSCFAVLCGRTAKAPASPRPTARRSGRCCGRPSPMEASRLRPSRATRRTALEHRSATPSRYARWQRQCWQRATRRRRSAWAASRQIAATPSLRRGWRGCFGWQWG